MRQAIKRALVAFAGATFFGTALAASQRTFVASTGLDTNACAITAPCRSFSAAITKTSAGGEVIVLDSAGYGPVTIAKSVSIIAPTGIYAGVTVFSGGNGITIDAPGIIVVLRGLSINGQGGTSGINLNQAARLRIENCVVSGMTNGIQHTADGAELIVLDTIVRDNLGAGLIIIADSSIVLDHVRSEHNLLDGFFMLSLNNGVVATITESLFAFNGRDGIRVAASIPSSTPRIVIDRSVLADNAGAGFALNGSGAVRSLATLTRNAIHRNGGDGASILGAGGGGTYVTMSENTIAGNATGIVSDGNATYVWVSANTLSIYDLGFKQANGGFFGSYRNNVGVSSVGSIDTLTGQ